MDVIKINFIKHLKDLGVSNVQIKKYLDTMYIFCVNEEANLRYVQYYFLQVLLGYEVNIYCFKERAELGTIQESLLNRVIEKESCTTVNLNTIMHNIQNSDKPMKFREHLLSLTDQEYRIIEEIRLNQEKTDFKISFDKGDNRKVKEFQIRRKLDNEEKKDIHKLANEIDFADFEDIKVHRGKVTAKAVWKKIRFDKDEGILTV